MIRLIGAVTLLLSGVAMAQSSLPVPPSTPGPVPAPAVAPPAKNLPPMPPGKSTVVGGEIRRVDPVRDQIALKVFGGNMTMKIFYDERTQVYRNGQRISVMDLKPEEHASVETALDGTNVFALRVHMLTTLPEGETQGQVIRFDPGSGELTLTASLSHESVRLHVPQSTPVVRMGQKDFTAGQRGLEDLMRGSLVNVKFQSTGRGEGSATHIEVLATPGSTFTFSGVLSFIDLHQGLLIIVDPQDNQSYRCSFSPSAFPDTGKLHEGSAVRLVAHFDGARYVASEITIE